MSLVVNTSFNVRETYYCLPTDAFKCFMGTEIDVLAIGNYILYKEQQDESLKDNYEKRYGMIEVIYIRILIIFTILEISL